MSILQVLVHQVLHLALTTTGHKLHRWIRYYTWFDCTCCTPLVRRRVMLSSWLTGTRHNLGVCSMSAQTVYCCVMRTVIHKAEEVHISMKAQQKGVTRVISPNQDGTPSVQLSGDGPNLIARVLDRYVQYSLRTGSICSVRSLHSCRINKNITCLF